MKKQGLTIFFFILLAANIAGAGANIDLLQFITKPLLMPVLAIIFLHQNEIRKSLHGRWVPAALFFSWAGDVLLMFQEKIHDFFLFGLTAFLIAHIFYIIFFHSVRFNAGISTRLVLFLPVMVYYAVLIFWLLPGLGDMKIPVIIYGLVISFMLVLALHMQYLRNKTAGTLMASGAVLFVISDSILAVNKFYSPFPPAGAMIMLTYGIAQYLIVNGACRYIQSINKQ